jgi:hypothetical protein
MSSGAWITAFLLFWAGGFLIIFIPWELINLVRGKETLSRYVMRRAREGSRPHQVLMIGLPALLACIGAWLFFHFEIPCFLIGALC